MEAGGLPLAATGEVVVELADAAAAASPQASAMALSAADATEFCRGPVTGGEASCFMPAELAAGPHQLTVTYSGDANFLSAPATPVDPVDPVGPPQQTVNE